MRQKLTGSSGSVGQGELYSFIFLAAKGPRKCSGDEDISEDVILRS